MACSIRSWGVVLSVVIVTLPLRLFAETPPVRESVDNAVIPDVTGQPVISTSETVRLHQGMAETDPVTVNNELEVLGTTIGVSEPALEPESFSNESTAIIESSRVVNPQEQEPNIGPTTGAGRAANVQSIRDTEPDLKSPKSGELDVATASTERSGEPVENHAAFSTRQVSQPTEMHPAAVRSETGEAADLGPIPAAVVLALLALVGVVQISRRDVTHF